MTKLDRHTGIEVNRRARGGGSGALALTLTVGLVTAAPGVARAQEQHVSAGAPPVMPVAPSVPTVRVQFGTPSGQAGSALAVPPFAAQCPLSATIRYNAAFNQLSAGRDAEAVALLDSVLSECPAHPHAAELRRLAALRALRAEANDESSSRPAANGGYAPAPAGEAPVNRPFGPESIAPLSRAELISGQTLSGFGMGLATCGAFGCSSAQALVLSTMLGGGAAFAGSYLGTRSGVTPGQTLAVNTGTYWGYINSGLIVGATSGSSLSGQAVAGVFLAGGLVGTAVGGLVAGVVSPPAYRVSMASSAGFWLAMLSLGGVLIAADNTSYPGVTPAAAFTTELVVANLGFLGGMLLGAYVPISRPRMLFIDLAGFVGALTGFGIGLVIPSPSYSSSSFNPSLSIMATGMMLGEVGGLILGYYLTRNFDPNVPASVQTAFMPIGPEGRPGLTFGLTL